MSSSTLPRKQDWNENVARVTSSERSDSLNKKQNPKLVHVIQNFFVKIVQVIITYRSFSDSSDIGDQWLILQSETAIIKVNKWFNLHINTSSSLSKHDLRLWKSCSDLGMIPPMILETYIDTRSLPSDHSGAFDDDIGRVWVVPTHDTRKHEVVLERWLIEFDSEEVSNDILEDLPLFYKRIIILIRALHMFTFTMPACRLEEAIDLQDGPLSQIRVSNKVLDGSQPIRSKGRIGLSKPIDALLVANGNTHILHKQFHTIPTIHGSIKVSVAYRSLADFSIDTRVTLVSPSSQGMDIPSHVRFTLKDHGSLDRASFTESSMSPRFKAQLPRAIHVDAGHAGINIPIAASPNMRPRDDHETPYVPTRPGILPFRAGTLSNSPPAHSNAWNPHATKADRRVSITSNRSTSNASLVALLRNPRNSFVSTNSPNLPIAISISNNSANSTHGQLIPRSIPSSHGSNLNADDHLSSTPDSISGTPRFSSLFGQRAGRRLLIHSMNISPLINTFVPENFDRPSMGTSISLSDSNQVLSGIYIDEDISAFVKMIDTNSDLMLSAFGAKKDGDSQRSSLQKTAGETLSRFHSLRSQHQQLGDSVSASISIHRDHSGTPESNYGSGTQRTNSRRSSRSVPPSPPMPHSSFEHRFMPSIHSRLKSNVHDERLYSLHVPIEAKHKRSNSPFQLSGLSLSHPGSSRLNQDMPTHSRPQTSQPLALVEKSRAVVGLSTTPSTYNTTNKRYYEHVFENDADEEVGTFNTDPPARPYPEYQAKEYGDHHTLRGKRASSDAFHDEFDDEELLFTMSDMHLSKH